MKMRMEAAQVLIQKMMETIKGKALEKNMLIIKLPVKSSLLRIKLKKE